MELKKYNNNQLLVTAQTDDIMAAIREIVREELKNLNDKPEDKLVSTDETCRVFKITRATLNKWRNNNWIQSTKVGNRVMFKMSDIMNAGNMKFQHNKKHPTF